MNALFGVIGAFAALSWVVAVIQAVRIVQLAPKGEKLGSYFALGWWKFGQIEAKAGAAAVPHLQIYQRAVVAFLAFIVIGLLLSGWAVSQQKRPAATAAALSTGLPVDRADFVSATEFRRVAMPGEPNILES